MIQRYKRPDKKDALSILNAAKREMAFTLNSLKIEEKSSSTIKKTSATPP